MWCQQEYWGASGGICGLPMGRTPPLAHMNYHLVRFCPPRPRKLSWLTTDLVPHTLCQDPTPVELLGAAKRSGGGQKHIFLALSLAQLQISF